MKRVAKYRYGGYRSLTGEGAVGLVKLLNYQQPWTYPEDCRRRVFAWMDVVRHLGSIRLKGLPAHAWGVRGDVQEELFRRIPELKTFRALAKEFPSVPAFSWDEIDGNWRLMFERRSLQLERHRQFECGFADLVLDCANDGTLEKVHQCVCGRWFFAKKEDQKSCGSARCRHRRYEQTEAFQKKRKVYMHWRYAVNGSKAWMGIPEGKRPTFEQWKKYNEPTPDEWKEILRRQKKGAR